MVALWILANGASRLSGVAELDPAPCFWLQGLVGLGAWLAATVVPGKQHRLSRLEE